MIRRVAFGSAAATALFWWRGETLAMGASIAIFVSVVIALSFFTPDE
jgi:hypothetical protein